MLHSVYVVLGPKHHGHVHFDCMELHCKYLPSLRLYGVFHRTFPSFPALLSCPHTSTEKKER